MGKSMSAFEEGYRNFTRLSGAYRGAAGGGDYVANVEKAIGELERALNSDLRFTLNGVMKRTDISQLKGEAAEIWHAYTHNIDAAVKDVSARAEVLKSHVAGSVDVQGNWTNSGFGLKYYKDGNAAAKAQSEIYYAKAAEYYKKGNQPLTIDEYSAYFDYEFKKYLEECQKNNRVPKTIDELFPGYKDGNNPLYSGQYRVVAKDQLEEARAWLERKILEESSGGRSEQVKRYQETLDKLTDRIKSNEGTESVPLAKEEAEELAKLAKEGGFDSADWGLTPDELIKWEHIMKQAHKAGLSAAVISVALEVAPELLKILTKLFRDGEINADDFKRVGFAALKGGTLGYVRGSVAAAITVACKSGKLGSALMNAADPTIIGAVVALTMNTIQNAVLMAFGQMTTHEFANRCAQDLFTASCSLAFGFALQGLLPQLPVLGFMIGSFVGGVIGSFAHSAVYSCFMSLCVDTGCTFFGLVKQDYTLPKEILKELGLEIFEYEKFEYDMFEYEEFTFDTFQFEEFEYTPINIRFIRRGVIGVGAVGFVT
ncbi:MAG: hypothetical protein FWH10_04005 [Oscillospiraceae bacterium]|nr:hypothetical protein [Oscillospiraceae bacterium]